MVHWFLPDRVGRFRFLRTLNAIALYGYWLIQLFITVLIFQVDSIIRMSFSSGLVRVGDVIETYC